jgi:hypothetical protein
LSGLEADGVISIIQERINSEPTAARALYEDHQRYQFLRYCYLEQEVIEALKIQGFYSDLLRRGVGGIYDFSRVRCLHTFYAAHLVVPNIIGKMIDAGSSGQDEFDKAALVKSINN